MRRPRVPITVEDFEPPLTETDLANLEAMHQFLRKHRWRLLFGRRDDRLLVILAAIADRPF